MVRASTASVSRYASSTQEIVLTGVHIGAYGRDRAGEMDPDLWELVGCLLAETEVRAGNLDAAETVLQRLLEVPGSRTTARLGLIQVAELRGRPAEARKVLEQIRAEDPAAAVPRLMLARMMLTAGEAAPASTACRGRSSTTSVWA